VFESTTPITPFLLVCPGQQPGLCCDGTAPRYCTCARHPRLFFHPWHRTTRNPSHVGVRLFEKNQNRLSMPIKWVPCVPAPVHMWIKLSESYAIRTRNQKIVFLFSLCITQNWVPPQHAPVVLSASHSEIRSERSFFPQAHVEIHAILLYFLQPDRTGVDIASSPRAN